DRLTVYADVRPAAPTGNAERQCKFGGLQGGRSSGVDFDLDVAVPRIAGPLDQAHRLARDLERPLSLGVEMHQRRAVRNRVKKLPDARDHPGDVPGTAGAAEPRL